MLVSLSFLTFLLFSTLAFLILTLFLLFLSSLCRHDKGKKKKGKQSCWQRSASPARGPRCLGLVHHGRWSHLQIRRETLKECKWERRAIESKREKRGTGNTDNTLANTYQSSSYTEVFGEKDKRIWPTCHTAASALPSQLKHLKLT